jgi:flagellin
MDAAGKIKEEKTMRINTNLTAMNTYTQYTKNNNKIASAVAKLSSGYAINTAADNAAGLAISEKMRAQIRGLDKASSNSQDAISLVQTAEGSLSESTTILQRMRELAVQSSSDTNQDDIDRTALQDEFSQLQSELDNISTTTAYNKKTLLDGSLSSSTKSVTNSALANNGMTVELGNAADGSYNFSVTTKLKSASIEGVKPTSFELTMGTDGYFSAGTATAGTSDAASSLLNGNYTISATYSTSTNNMTVTATGDNDQTFTATLSQTDLSALASSKTLAINFESSGGANDGFSLNMTLTNNITSSTDNYNTLATEISKMSTSISGGVTAQDATYGVYANLTGADSVELQSGQSSVTFDNGVKVNFNTLTSSAVDTTNKAALTTTGTVVTSPTAASVLTSVQGTSANIASATMTLSSANGKIAAGDYTITSDASGNLTLTDAAGSIFTAAANVTDATAASATDTETYAFHNADSSVTFNGVLALTAGSSAISLGTTIAFSNSLTGSAAYDLTGEATGSATFSDFAFTDDSTIANGTLAITSKVDGTNTVFTATDSKSNTYTATVATSALKSATSGGSVTNSLSFVSTAAGGNTSFTVDLNTTNATTTGTTFTDGAQFSATVAGTGHNYEKTFGSSTTDLSASTTSTFDVESTKNAGLTFQVGANEGDTMTINIDKMDSNYLGVSSASVATQTEAAAAITSVDSAINQVSQQRATLGAIENRLTYKIDNLTTSSTNLTSAESQIRDVDMAKEMTAFTNANILSQASTAMLAQANSLPQNVLSLLKS